MASDSDDDPPDQESSPSFDALLRDVARSEAREPPARDAGPGPTLGHYVIGGELGRGGMAVVYTAEDPRLGRAVALKVLPSAVGGDPERRRRFLREARAAAAVDHPNIATIYDVGEVDGLLYFAMERVEGRTLRARLAEGPIDRAEAVRVGRQIALGLARAHEKGIVHRDLKPENVMLTAGGGVKILDFGLAKLREPDAADRVGATPTPLTQEGRVLGTPGYMSPEQATARQVDERTDVYALGVVLHEMLTGELPGAHGGGRVVADARLAAILSRCLAQAPERRLANAGEAVTALDALDDGTRARHRRMGAWLSGALLLAAGIVAWRLFERGAGGHAAGSAPPIAAVGTCSSNVECVHAHGGAWRCHSERHVCVEIASADCKVYAEPRDAEADDVVWLGGMFPLDPSLVDEMRAAELARQDFARTLGPNAALTGALHARPIGLVVCDEGRDPVRAAHHLVDDVEVPAILGFRSTRSALTTIPTILLPKRVLAFVTISQAPAITAIPEPPGAPRLVWRSTLNRDDYAASIAHLVSDILEPAARAGPRGIGDRPFKVAAVWAKTDNHDVVESLFRELRFNGMSALDNGPNFRQLVFDSEGEAAADGVVERLVSFAPQVIDFAESAFDSKVLLPLEARWAEGPRPFYVTCEGLSEEDARFAGSDPSRRHRFFAVTSLSTTMTNAQLVLRYNLAFPDEPVMRATSPSPSYDAFYTLAYAIHALGDGVVSGAALSSAIRRLLPPGRRVGVGPAQISSAFEALRSSADGHIDLEGAIGSLDFDPATGEAPIDQAIVCLGVDDHGMASGAVDSGLMYDPSTKRLVGALHCP